MQKKATKVGVAFVLVGLLILIGLFLAWPRYIRRQITRFAERHPVGSSIGELVDDQFIESGTILWIRTWPGAGPANEDFFDRHQEGVLKFREQVKHMPSGRLELGWVSSPYESILLNVDFSTGQVTNVTEKFRED